MEEASERGSAVIDAARTGLFYRKTLEDVIAERPLATVGLALALGLLIGVTVCGR